MPARVFAITPGSPSVELAGADPVDVTFTVKNTSDRELTCRAEPVPLAPVTAEWLSVKGDAEKKLAAGVGTHQFVVAVTPPPGTPEGMYSFRFNATGVENPDEYTTEGPVVGITLKAAVAGETGEPGESRWWIWVALAAVVLVGAAGGWVLLREPADAWKTGLVDVVREWHEARIAGNVDRMEKVTALPFFAANKELKTSGELRPMLSAIVRFSRSSESDGPPRPPRLQAYRLADFASRFPAQAGALPFLGDPPPADGGVVFSFVNESVPQAMFLKPSPEGLRIHALTVVRLPKPSAEAAARSALGRLRRKDMNGFIRIWKDPFRFSGKAMPNPRLRQLTLNGLARTLTGNPGLLPEPIRLKAFLARDFRSRYPELEEDSKTSSGFLDEKDLVVVGTAEGEPRVFFYFKRTKARPDLVGLALETP